MWYNICCTSSYCNDNQWLSSRKPIQEKSSCNYCPNHTKYWWERVSSTSKEDDNDKKEEEDIDDDENEEEEEEEEEEE